MDQQASTASDERGELRKKILLLVRYCAFVGPSRNSALVLHVLAEVEKLKARYRALDPARQGTSAGNGG